MSVHSLSSKFPKSVQAVITAVESWREFSFTYEDKTFTVLGAIVGVDSLDRICLWADVLAIDTQPQTPAFLKRFDVEDMHILPGKGKLHGKCSNDYTAIARGCEAFYAYGPRWDKQQESSKAAAGSSAHETPEGKRGKARSARAMLESLFSPGK